VLLAELGYSIPIFGKGNDFVGERLEEMLIFFSESVSV